jgi:hypothetical protein
MELLKTTVPPEVRNRPQEFMGREEDLELGKVQFKHVLGVLQVAEVVEAGMVVEQLEEQLQPVMVLVEGVQVIPGE